MKARCEGAPEWEVREPMSPEVGDRQKAWSFSRAGAVAAEVLF